MKTTYHEARIDPSHSTQGEWILSLADIGEGWGDEADLLDKCMQNVGPLYELGEDELPDKIEDIRSNIRNQEGRIFGYLTDDDEAQYFAIVACESSD